MKERARASRQRREYKKPVMQKRRKLSEVTEGVVVTVTGQQTVG